MQRHARSVLAGHSAVSEQPCLSRRRAAPCAVRSTGSGRLCLRHLRRCFPVRQLLEDGVRRRRRAGPFDAIHRSVKFLGRAHAEGGCNGCRPKSRGSGRSLKIGSQGPSHQNYEQFVRDRSPLPICSSTTTRFWQGCRSCRDSFPYEDWPRLRTHHQQPITRSRPDRSRRSAASQPCTTT